MLLLFSLSPIVVTIAGLLLRLRSVYAALLGVLTAVAVSIGYFPIQDWSGTSIWLVVMVEVLLIVGGGLLLAQALQTSGAQEQLSHWVHHRTGSGVKGVLLVVHGVVPFAESLTGFGIGITIGIPLLLHMGLEKRKVAAIGLLGLCAIPWGSMGPGTLVAAKMSGLSFDALGLASAVFNVVPFVLTGMAAAYIASESGQKAQAVLMGAVSGLTLAVLVFAANACFGTAPAGALAALIMVLGYVFTGRFSEPQPLPTLAKRALCSYAVLLLGVLGMGLAYRLGHWSESWRLLASPGLWLFVATAYLSWGMAQRQAVLRTTWQNWLRVAPVTALFIVLGIVMTVSGMAKYLAQGLASSGTAYLALAPSVGALGGYITGSNVGANAMFAATQSHIAQALQVNVLWFMAIHNVCAAFLLMSSPGKIEMALSLSGLDDAESRRWLTRRMLAVAAVVVGMLTMVNVLLAQLA